MEESCPATPLVLTGRDSKSPLQVELSSPESDSRKSPGRDSPDSRCVICLGRLQNKSFTDSCLHQFCFQCLLQWSKVKAECPLCKQPFKSIIHNVRSNLDYDQYHIEHGEPHYVLSDLMHSYNFDLIPVNRRFRYRSTMTREYFRELAESFLAHTRRLPEDSFQINPLVPVDPAPASSVRRSNRLHTSSTQQRPRQRGTSEFRRNVYEQDLWVQDLSDISGRYRECTPQFYRENPAQIHRIIPWLNREVNVLLSDCESHAAYVLSRIISLLTQHSIRSREFREQIQSYFGNRTDHFIHELYNFARSVYDIAGFDQNAVYGTNPNYATEVQEISSSSDNDSDIEVLETIKTEEKKVKKSSKQGFKKLLLKRASDAEARPDEPVAGPSGITSGRTSESIDICESDPDEVKVLDYVKPEPEVVTLSSGDEAQPFSDLDVSNGEYAEVVQWENKKFRRSSSSDSESRKSRSRSGRGSDSKGLESKKTKRKHKKNKTNRSSSESSSSSSDTSLSSSISSTDSSSSCFSTHSTGSFVSSHRSSKSKRKKSRKKSKKKISKISHKRHKASSDDDRKRRKRVKSCVIVPKRPRTHHRRRHDDSSSESSRLKSYWSMALSDRSYNSRVSPERERPRKHKTKRRSCSSEKTAVRRPLWSSTEEETSSSSSSSRIHTSKGTSSPGSGDLPSSSGIPSMPSNSFTLFDPCSRSTGDFE